MIKREYFYTGRIITEDRYEFNGTHRSTSFFQDSVKVMKEIEEHIFKKTGIEKEKILIRTFHRI